MYECIETVNLQENAITFACLDGVFQFATIPVSGGGEVTKPSFGGGVPFDSKYEPIIPPMFDKNMTHNSVSMMKTMHIIPYSKEHFSINNKYFAIFFQSGAHTSTFVFKWYP